MTKHDSGKMRFQHSVKTSALLRALFWMQVKYRELKQKCLSNAVSHDTSRYQQDEGSQTLYSSLKNAKTPRHVTYEVINVVLKSHLNLHLALSTNTLYFSVPFLSIISFTKCNLACPASEVMTLLMISKN